MSAIPLMMCSSTNRTWLKKRKVEEKKDTGTCLNCCYQRTGSKECNTCKRSFEWQYYKAPKNLKDNFKISN